MDWGAFLDAYSVPYVDRGPNTKRGELSIQCPFCGEDDPSQHLGISLQTENWGCLRNPQHRGKSAPNLIRALLGCGWAEAVMIAGQYSHVDPDGLGDALKALEAISEAPKAVVAPSIQAPPLRPIKPIGLTTRFWRYLASRGFDDVQRLLDEYNIQCCLTGKYKDRVIIPLYQHHELFAWTGRALINPVNAPRYLSSEGDNIKQTVFNEDDLQAGGEVLVIVEGPFDALKLDYYGKALSVRATCGFGTSLSMAQIALLNRLCKRFKRVVVLFDHNAVEPAFNVIDWLSASNAVIGQLPNGVKDPGELDNKQITRLIQQYKKDADVITVRE